MTLLEYVRDCCGDTLAERPFCEADNLAIAQISYLELARCVPALGAGTVSIREAWHRYVETYDRDYIYSLSGVGIPLAPFVLQGMAKSPRFGDARIGGFSRIASDERHEQFAALYVTLSDGTTYVAYRGTDSSFAGWREDLMLSYEVVPAQIDARDYLQRAAKQCAGPLMVGGHSKGGNLAAYAAAYATKDVRSRITDVWCNDSPGFERLVADFGRLQEVAPLTHFFTPAYSVVGGLMEHIATPEVVVSDDVGILQHGMTGWELTGDGALVRAQRVSPEALRIGGLFDKLLKNRDLAGRESYVSDVFGALAATGATTFDELAAMGPAGIESVVSHLSGVDKDSRDTTRDLLFSLLSEMLDSSVSNLVGKPTSAAQTPGDDLSVEEMERHRARKRRAQDRLAPINAVRAVLASDALRNYATLGCGLVVLANAGRTAPVVAYLLVIAVAVYSVFLLARYFTALRRGTDADVEDLLVGVITAVPAIAVLFFRVAVTAVYNLLIAGALLAWGIALLRRLHLTSGTEFLAALKRPLTWNALLAIGFSLVIIADPTDLTHWLLAVTGVYVAAQGIWGLVRQR